MKKTILKRCLLGAPAGLSVYVLFTLFASWLRGDGTYYFTGGYLVWLYGTELNAVTVACICAMLIGMIWAAASLIFQTDWSLMKQTAVHYLACTVPSLLINCAFGTMPRSMDGLMQYLWLFGCIYVLIWIGQYICIRKRVRQMNAMLNTAEEKE